MLMRLGHSSRRRKDAREVEDRHCCANMVAMADSVKFCHEVGMITSALSPFRVPIARLAAAPSSSLRKTSEEKEGKYAKENALNESKVILELSAGRHFDVITCAPATSFPLTWHLKEEVQTKKKENYVWRPSCRERVERGQLLPLLPGAWLSTQ